MIQLNEKESSLIRPWIEYTEGGEVRTINLTDVAYFEAMGNYVKVLYKNGQRILIYSTMKDLAGKLPEAQFLRVHRSFIINCSIVDKVRNTFVDLENMTKAIPVSKTKKKRLLELVELE